MNPHADPGSDPAGDWDTATLRRHTLTLDLDRPPLWMNEWRRVHYRKQHKSTLAMLALIRAALQSQPIPAMQRAEVTFTLYAPDKRRRDADGLGALGKDALDALVVAGVLPDDNSNHVDQVAYRIRLDRARPRIEIELKEVAA